MLVCDYPSKEGFRNGKPLAGRVGQQVAHALGGLPHAPGMEDMYVTCLIKEWNEENEYTDDDEARDKPELLDELAAVAPEVVITLGRRSMRFFLGDLDLDDTQALPWIVDLLDAGLSDIVVFPIMNPAAGFKNAEAQNMITYGFQCLNAYFGDKLAPRRLFDDQFPDPRYLDITDPAWVRAAFKGLKAASIDTEGHPHNPYSIQVCVQPGTAYMIRRKSTDALHAMLEVLAREKPRLTYHSALHERPMFRALADAAAAPWLIKDLDRVPFDDTMIMAYLLQNEPQGLKPLSVRECGMRMQSYMEILAGPAEEVAREYLQSLWDIEHIEHEHRREQAFWAELAKGRKIKVTPKLPKSDLQKSVERCLKSKRPRGLWEDQVIDRHVAAYKILGDMPEATLDLVEPEVATHYGCRDADATERVKPHLWKKIQSMGLEKTYNLELATYPLIDRMHTIGMKPDLGHMAILSDAMGFYIDELREKLVGMTGIETFNANSGDQVEAYLDGLGLMGHVGSKRTASGRNSTNKKILEGLEKQHGADYPVISTILEYRSTYKLKNTFIDRIPDFVNRHPFDGRVHSTFRTTRVVTGRLAASDPNLLAQPKHGQFAKDFRRGWVAEEGHVLCSWDQSQVELRVLADLSQDPALLQAFRTGSDLHAALAVRIFGGTEDDHKKGKGRLAAKAINFGIPMGMQAQGLTVELRKNGVLVTQDDAQRWLDETMAAYPEVPRYQQWMIAEARREGFIRCMSGRIRYIGGIKSWDDYTRGEAERFAFSTPIQEGAQYIMKTAEKHVWEDVIQGFQMQGRYVEPVVQIHDDLVLEAEDDPEFLKELNVAMQWAMTETFHGLSVPLATSGDAGYNWQDMEEIAA
jgi:DNA polymerase I-like protein with 3'-5' exonuclease and polymerase domains/uracil-DNA glycosylase